jgi:NDP-sugar pyrophosphorylase family protein
MRVMIMAAGKGTRLRPLTDFVPKPMAPIVNRPAIHHILRLLYRHGFREVVINLHHLPEAVTTYLGDGSWMGMKITYSTEPELLGTAGGVKNNQLFLGSDTFLVMSGDSLTDIDLTGLAAAHRRNGSIATIAVKEVVDPSLYGVVVLDDDHRVVGFQEKPSLAEARSRLCNCGIYVLEPEIFDHIPADRFDDFGSRLFPYLLDAGVPFHAEPIEAYWSDVGNLAEYVRGNADALLGRVQVEKPGMEVRPGVWMGNSVRVAESARLEPPLVIGRDCVIGADVVVEGPSVIGSGTIVGAGAHVFRGVVLPHSEVPVASVVVDGVMGHKLSPTGREV